MKAELKEKINEIKSEIDSLRPIDSEREKRIQQKFRLDWNYHSNNIEGNSLTFGETKSFLLHGITADGKPLKDHLDIKGHNEALLILEDVIKDNRPLNENFIRELHQIILHEPYDNPAITPDGKASKRRINIGSYKKQQNHVKTKTGEVFYFASPEETPAKMNDLMDWYNRAIEQRKLHPVEIASMLHYKFIRIHPFDDGNGRLARILMNLSLMRFGFTPVIIKTQKKEEYYRALQQADGGEEELFINYIASLSIDSLGIFLKGAKGEAIEEDDDIDKEIALLKAELVSKKITETYSINKEIEILFWLKDNLLKSIDSKIIQLNELFEENIIAIQSQGGEYYFSRYKKQNLSKEKLIEERHSIDFFISEAKNKRNETHDIVISLCGFDKPGYSRFNAQSITKVYFEKYSFVLSIITLNNTKKIHILYDDLATDMSKTINDVVKTIIEDLLEQIKRNKVQIF